MPVLIDHKIIQTVKETAAKLQLNVYLVGGAVRDIILNQGCVTDVDFVVDKDLDLFVTDFCKLVSGKIVEWSDKDRRVFYKQKDTFTHVDFAAMTGLNITDDLMNRDITVNAIAININRLDAFSPQYLIDPANALQDIQNRKIKACGPRSFINDPVRILRALRFARKFNYRIPSETLVLMREAADLINRPAIERVKKEFFILLDQNHPEKSIRQMDEIGVLTRLIPEISQFKGLSPGQLHHQDLFNHSICTVAELPAAEKRISSLPAGKFIISEFSPQQQIEEGITRKSLLVLTALLHDSGKTMTRQNNGRSKTHYGHETAGMDLNREICKNIGLGKKGQAMVATMTRHHMRVLHLSLQDKLTERAMKRFIDAAADLFFELLLLSVADSMAIGRSPNPDRIIDVISNILDIYRRDKGRVSFTPLLNGNDIIRMTGLRNSPQIGQLLNKLCELESSGTINTREEALAWLKKNKNIA